MNILMVLHSHGCGGAEKHALLLMQGLIDNGYNVSWCGPRDSWLGDATQSAGIPCHHLAMHGFYDLYSVARLAWLARRLDARVIHGHLTRGAWYAGLAGRLAGVPALATAHSTNALKHFGRCRRIIAVCRQVEIALASRGYPADRLRLVYNGVPDPGPADAEHRRRARRLLDLPADQPVLGMIARYIPDKGHDILLDAIARLGDSAPPVVLFGDTSGEYHARVRAHMDRLQLNGKVRMAGQRDDLVSLLPALDLMVAPSRREAMSLAIIEACAAGLPVIATRVGGIPEIVEDGCNGLLVPAEDVQALATAIRQLVSDEALRRRLGDAARRRYLESFSLATMVDRTAAIYLEPGVTG